MNNLKPVVQEQKKLLLVGKISTLTQGSGNDRMESGFRYYGIKRS